MFSRYRNQSTGLQSKSIDWFLYEEITGRWMKCNTRLKYAKPFCTNAYLSPISCHWSHSILSENIRKPPVWNVAHMGWYFDVLHQLLQNIGKHWYWGDKETFTEGLTPWNAGFYQINKINFARISNYWW